jgi:DNA-binding transcriptional MocR family regulator
MSPWCPDLTGRQGPRYLAIVNALAADIASGRIAEGTRLPAQRELADRLGMSVGTVTKAYLEAQRQGLISGEIGRGTYVRSRLPSSAFRTASPRIINLALNVAPPTGEDGFVTSAMRSVADRGELGELLDYSPHQGRRDHRVIILSWLAAFGVRSEPSNVIITHGAQHGILIALSLIAKSGDAVLTECFTYSGIASLAAYNGYRLHGVAMDEQGIVPGALERAFAETGSRVLYAMPTFQTPTNTMMSSERRGAIGAILRKHDAYLVEDDVYGFLSPEPIRPLSAETPDRAFYVTSFAKCVAPGLRVGAAVVPIAFRDMMTSALRATSWMAAPITVEILARMIETGDLARLVELKRAEAARRSNMARRLLPLGETSFDIPSFHVWLPIADQGSLAGLVGEVGLKGVGLAPPTYVAPGRAKVSGIRLCLGAPRSIEDLEYALKVVGEAVTSDEPLATL